MKRKRWDASPTPDEEVAELLKPTPRPAPQEELPPPVVDLEYYWLGQGVLHAQALVKECEVLSGQEGFNPAEYHKVYLDLVDRQLALVRYQKGKTTPAKGD